MACVYACDCVCVSIGDVGSAGSGVDLCAGVHLGRCGDHA